MNEFAPRRERHQLSMASIGRLRELLQAVRVAIDAPRESWSDRGMRSKLDEQWWQRQIHERPLSLHVDAAHESTARNLVTSIEEVVNSVARRLDQSWRRGQAGEVKERQDHIDGRVWTLGAVDYLLEERPILRGDIELRKTEPIAANIPDMVVEYLVTVSGTRDQLARETHGHWGYHYHYLDSKNRRSDTLLTFDRDSPNTVKATLCWERHAEGQKFKARAGMWGTDKRESVYSVCHPDTLRFNVKDFKRPASDAEVVWPCRV